MKIKTLYGFLIILLVILGLFALVLFKYLLPRDTRYSSQSELLRNQQVQPSVSETLAKSSIIDKFLILVGAEVQRDSSGYNIKEKFIPKIIGENDRSSYLQSSEGKKIKDSLYKIEVINNDDKQEIYYSAITYCPPRIDVCTSLTNTELPVNSGGFLDPFFIPINPNIKIINFYINNVLVKSIPKKESALKIVSLTKKPKKQMENYFTIVDGYRISWKIDNPSNDKVWVILEYLASPTKWQYAIFGDSKDYGSYFVNPKTIQSTLESIDFRLIITDGFNTDIWVEKNLITASKDRKIELFLQGIDDGDSFLIGQGANLELSFFDPETGIGCGSRGCLEGENKDKYEVIWSSDKQTICLNEFFKNEIYYVFKKEGFQTIKVKVQHKDKPYLKGEKSIKVHVQSDGFYFEDKNPNC